MTALLARSRLEQILGAARDLKIGVLGDFTLDAYWYADMERSQLSRETPLYPRPVVRETYSPGGAANVAWNLAALGVGEVWAYSVLGDDWRGAILRELLENAGIRTRTLLAQDDRRTPFYGKVVLTATDRCRQEDARLDFVNTQPLSEVVESALLAELQTGFQKLDALIVADYLEQGVVTRAVSAGLRTLAGQQPGFPVVVDSRERAAEFRELVLKPNEIEAAGLFFPGRDPAAVRLAELASAALEQVRRSGKPVFITRGAQGCLACAGDGCQAIPGVLVPPPVDTVGAGDAFMASLTAALAAGASPTEAASLANLSAAVTVTQIGVTGTASPEAVAALYESWSASLDGLALETFNLRA